MFFVRTAKNQKFELFHKSYGERLTILNLTTLEELRMRGDLIQQYKISTKLTK
jgi:hypothetical protein